MTEPSGLALVPTDCEECDCPQFHWDGRPVALRMGPPHTCTCSHVVYRHRFRPERRPKK